MEDRRRNENDGNGLGCLFALFEILLVFLVWGTPTQKKIAWSIVGILLFLGLLGQAGLSADEALAVLGVIIIIVIMVVIIKAFCNASRKRAKHYSQTQNEQSAEPEGGVEIKTKKENTFEEQFAIMEEQAGIVNGEEYQLGSEEPETVEEVPEEPQEKYYNSIEDVLEQKMVPAEYQKIMIEQIRQTDVKECPGLIWKDSEMLYVFPMLRNGEVHSWPLTSVPIILYEKRSNPNVDKEYQEVLLENIGKEFNDVLPEYSIEKEGVYTGKFVLPIGLEVTNTSGKALFNILSAEFHIVDEVMQSTVYSKEIKEIYKAHILYENHIITDDAYAEIKEQRLNECKKNENDNSKYQQQVQLAKELML